MDRPASDFCFFPLKIILGMSKAIFIGRLFFLQEMCLQSMKLTFLHRVKGFLIPR